MAQSPPGWFAEPVGDIADPHTLLDVRPTLHQRVEDALVVAGDAVDALDPDWVLRGRGCTWQHLEVADGVEAAVDQRVEIIGLARARVSGFGSDGRLAT